jgi:hypothetical protein
MVGGPSAGPAWSHEVRDSSLQPLGPASAASTASCTRLEARHGADVVADTCDRACTVGQALEGAGDDAVHVEVQGSGWEVPNRRVRREQPLLRVFRLSG